MPPRPADPPVKRAFLRIPKGAFSKDPDERRKAAEEMARELIRQLGPAPKE
jgi:hypothetical protein